MQSLVFVLSYAGTLFSLKFRFIANMLEVRGEQQVMLRVKIAEISRNLLKELGIETRANDPSDSDSARILLA